MATAEGTERQAHKQRDKAITAYLVFPDWQTLMTTLINSKPPPEIEKQIAG